MIIISTFLTVPSQPSPQFHVEAWLPFRNCEMVYSNLWMERVLLIIDQGQTKKGSSILYIDVKECGIQAHGIDPNQ